MAFLPIRKQLVDILSEVLPSDSEQAITGTELIAIIKNKLTGEFSENSIRNYFSEMSRDPTSPIAKVDQGNGYYKRTISENSIEPETEYPTNSPKDEIAIEDKNRGRANQDEEKFRSLFIKWCELNGEFPIYIEHLSSKRRQSGINKWKFPDVVSVKWEVLQATDDGFRLEKDLFEIKRSLGEQPFKLTSTELKVDISTDTLRSSFFQCVSNSKWAHNAQLVVAKEITDETIAEEFRRLGKSYDVSVISFELTDEILKSLPDAKQILEMSSAKIESIMKSPKKISSGKERDGLDWEHLRDLRTQSRDINSLFSWVAFCLTQRKAYSFRDWLQISEIEKRVQSA